LDNKETERLSDMLIYEKGLYAIGYKSVAGVDEAGRGPLAGDVFAAALILPEGLMIEGINDSKKLSEKKREQLYDVIIENAITWAVGRATPEEIDEINILNATYLAMNRAINSLNFAPDFVLIDGNLMRGLDTAHKCVVKGDSKSLTIAAASIIAKVSRDRYIKNLSEKYPEYNFAKHKGYGTPEHIKAIIENGPCPIHRKTFLKNWGEKDAV